eukprot:TRINITY_DN38125_c0_g1_i1.p1 TRINITY_DN38125_c0_g1~~TRINITY_DN38125_c0_g1_i1.p1  ORF type:complete len:227 (+),score=72.28 TRINITY_DN38125_c0_g1_i1:37-717(+)
MYFVTFHVPIFFLPFFFFFFKQKTAYEMLRSLVGSEMCIRDSILVKTDPIFSPLTPITGLTTDEISNGVELGTAMEEVRAHLGPDVHLVGQRIQNDIEWLGLVDGEDFGMATDIADMFKAWNPRYNNFMFFSLAKEAYALLGISMHGPGSHSPIQDAEVSLRLFLRYHNHTDAIEEARQTMAVMTYTQQWPVGLTGAPTPIDGVCCHSFNPGKCFCGQRSKAESSF